MTTDTARLDAYFNAILTWREHIDIAFDGFASFDNPASARTMLFACNTWLAADVGDDESYRRVSQIKAEIEDWLRERHEPYLG